MQLSFVARPDEGFERVPVHSLIHPMVEEESASLCGRHSARRSYLPDEYDILGNKLEVEKSPVFIYMQQPCSAKEIEDGAQTVVGSLLHVDVLWHLSLSDGTRVVILVALVSVAHDLWVLSRADEGVLLLVVAVFCYYSVSDDTVVGGAPDEPADGGLVESELGGSASYLMFEFSLVVAFKGALKGCPSGRPDVGVVLWWSIHVCRFCLKPCKLR